VAQAPKLGTEVQQQCWRMAGWHAFRLSQLTIARGPSYPELISKTWPGTLEGLWQQAQANPAAWTELKHTKSAQHDPDFKGPANEKL
jgi:hypothetical protein